MKCPVDETELRHVVRHGVGLDICPSCQGIWLERGELDGIIEAATPAVVLPEPGAEDYAVEMPPPEPPGSGPVVMDDPTPGADPAALEQERGNTQYSHARRWTRKRRKGFLADVFGELDPG